MTLTKLLEKIKRDHDEAHEKRVTKLGIITVSLVEASKTHHESLLKALEIAIKQRDNPLSEFELGTDDYYREMKKRNVKIEAVLKGCGE